jgi:hypothetical protein
MMENIRSLKWADYIIYALADPRKLVALVMAGEQKMSYGALVIPFIVSFFEMIALALPGEQTSFFYNKLTYGALFYFLLMILHMALLASMIDAVCQFLGHAGSVRRLINILLLSLLPRALILPIVYILKVLHFAPGFFYVLFGIAFMVWSALIVIQGISEMHAIPFSKSALIFLFPYAFTGTIFFLLAALVVINLLGYISIL